MYRLPVTRRMGFMAFVQIGHGVLLDPADEVVPSSEQQQDGLEAGPKDEGGLGVLLGDMVEPLDCGHLATFLGDLQAIGESDQVSAHH
jgi:hypothetical protein